MNFRLDSLLTCIIPCMAFHQASAALQSHAGYILQTQCRYSVLGRVPRLLVPPQRGPDQGHFEWWTKRGEVWLSIPPLQGP